MQRARRLRWWIAVPAVAQQAVRRANRANSRLDALPAAAAWPAGPAAADGQFSRALATVLFATLTRTVSVTVAAIVDGVADRCTFDGLAVPAG